MNIDVRLVTTGMLSLCMVLSGCLNTEGDPNDLDDHAVVNTDYSQLRVAEVPDSPLSYAADDQAVLSLLRNGLRMSLTPQPVFAGVAGSPLRSAYSDTTVQVEGVDEADPVKYDGRYMYILKPVAAEPIVTPMLPGSPTASIMAPTYTSTLKIVRTNSVTATTELMSEFRIDRRQAYTPSLYRVKGAPGTTQSDTTEYVAALSAVDQAPRMLPTPYVGASKIAIDLLDVRDPRNVSLAWRLQIEGWLRTSRQIGNTLYLVSSYSPLLATLNYQAGTDAERQANERLIIAARPDEMLPRYWVNDAAAQALIAPRDCLVPTTRTPVDAYLDLVVVTAINLSERRIADVACLSASENGVYASQDNLYIGGSSYRRGTSVTASVADITVLHKFALTGGMLDYRGTGAVEGTLGWSNSSYFMDEFRGDLRIVTTRNRTFITPGILPSVPTHHLSVLRESAGQRLAVVASLPNAAHPEPIGKPGESIQAVRFAGERGYVVTFRRIDPLYVLDLRQPTDPVIAGSLEVPGFSTYLRPLGANYLLGVGQHIDSTGRQLGVKVELFDIRDIARPLSVGSRIFGRAWDSLLDFHALSFVTLSGTTARYRMAMPLNVFDTPSPTPTGPITWSYSGLHLFEISGLENGTPLLHFQGVLKAEEVSSQTRGPTFSYPIRSVLHDDSVFFVYGDRIVSSLWQDVR